MNGKHLSFSILQFDKIKGAIPVERLLNKPLLKCNGDFGLFRFDDQMRQKQTQNMHGFVATERPGVAVTPPGILLARPSGVESAFWRWGRGFKQVAACVTIRVHRKAVPFGDALPVVAATREHFLSCRFAFQA